MYVLLSIIGGIFVSFVLFGIPRFTHYIYTLELRLMAVFTFTVIHGASLSLHVTILFGMCFEYIPISLSVNTKLISSRFSLKNKSCQFVFLNSLPIWSIVADM